MIVPKLLHCVVILVKSNKGHVRGRKKNAPRSEYSSSSCLMLICTEGKQKCPAGLIHAIIVSVAGTHFHSQIAGKSRRIQCLFTARKFYHANKKSFTL